MPTDNLELKNNNPGTMAIGLAVNVVCVMFTAGKSAPAHLHALYVHALSQRMGLYKTKRARFHIEPKGIGCV